jgi:hypothetical protein
MSAGDSLERLLIRYPIPIAVAIIGGLYLFIKAKSASAAPSPPIGPNPGPPGPSPGVLPTVQAFVLVPGSFPITIAAGSGFTLQLPPGAKWTNVQGISPVIQPPSSVIGGTVNPMTPTGSESQTWTNVTGEGTLMAAWVDSAGVTQAATIAVTTTGSANKL